VKREACAVKTETSNVSDKRRPQYYSSLAPFADLFRRGRPILTYHHVGPRPRGARLKGLYVDTALFARQLEELNAAHFSTPGFSSAIAASAKEPAHVFLTFDDGFRDVFQNALPLLRQKGFRAIQFLVADLLGRTNVWQQEVGDVSESLMDEAQVRDWLAAGQEIGSHTSTHPWLTRLSLGAAREEIRASKKKLEDRFGVTIHHFCYPYGDWNSAVRDLVAEAGYLSACTTKVGLNQIGAPPFELRRFTARYPSRNLKALWARVSPFSRA
jgi:peptidoglycan/xylan/chitin deacetylase (PgdA/CDA1 family)